MTALKHSEWWSLPSAQRDAILWRLNSFFSVRAERLLEPHLREHATSSAIALIRAQMRAEAAQFAAEKGDPLPPLWVDARMGHDRLKLDISAPRHRHDCDECSFLGRFDEYDLYACTKGPMPTVIARYGDEGRHYKSGAALAAVDTALAEAARREQGR